MGSMAVSWILTGVLGFIRGSVAVFGDLWAVYWVLRVSWRV